MKQAEISTTASLVTEAPTVNPASVVKTTNEVAGTRMMSTEQLRTY
jgi:hypothetical protein